MLHHLERPGAAPPRPARILADSGPGYFANGLIGFIFSATGPVAIILSVGSRGGLSEAELASWVFGVFFINGLITIAMSWRYTVAAGLRVDHPRHGAGRSGAAAPELCRGDRRVLRHRRADLRAGGQLAG
jgi:hypothetical protein